MKEQISKDTHVSVTELAAICDMNTKQASDAFIQAIGMNTNQKESPGKFHSIGLLYYTKGQTLSLEVLGNWLGEDLVEKIQTIQTVYEDTPRKRFEIINHEPPCRAGEFKGKYKKLKRFLSDFTITEIELAWTRKAEQSQLQF